MDRRTGHGTIILEIEGLGVEVLDRETGGHRVQRVPPTEKRGRVHSSSVTIAVLDPQSGQPRTDDVDDPGAFKIEWFGGTTGAGGQHHNKHENACRITHLPTGTVRIAQTRSRKSSQQLAMAELKKVLKSSRGQQAAAEINDIRRGQIGSASKADNRRTYRFQDGLVSDRLTGRKGRIDDVLSAGQFWRLW